MRLKLYFGAPCNGFTDARLKRIKFVLTVVSRGQNKSQEQLVHNAQPPLLKEPFKTHFTFYSLRVASYKTYYALRVPIYEWNHNVRSQSYRGWIVKPWIERFESEEDDDAKTNAWYIYFVGPCDTTCASFITREYYLCYDNMYALKCVAYARLHGIMILLWHMYNSGTILLTFRY